jgi:predicted nucleotide-binding protein
MGTSAVATLATMAGVEHRHEDALRRILQADDALLRDGREPEAFHLRHTGGGGREISHPRWDPSWAVPSEHTIDDLGELGLLRIEPSSDKARTFALTMAGRQRGSELAEGYGSETRDSPEEAGGAVAAKTSKPEQTRDRRKVAVMHGRDLAARRAVVDLLRGLGLDPLEWDDLVDRTGSAAPYNGEAVATAFKVAQAVVVVLTPDDVGYLHPTLHGAHEREDDREPTGQPRLNVVLEAGMALQSHPNRTVLIEIGRTREISDLAGLNTIRLDGSPARFNSLANRLESAGCPVRRTGSDWLDPGAFDRLGALRRDAPRGTPRPPADSGDRTAKLHARHLSVELDTIDRTVDLALRNGYWWNIAVEVLPAHEWAAGRDALAQHSPATYDAVAAAYVEADLMNKAAYNHAQGGHDDYDDAVRERLEALRTSIGRAKTALKNFAEDT